MKHKHAEIIAAYIEGTQCEYYSHELEKWGYVTQLETFDWAHTVRIKPEPQEEPPKEPQYLYVYNDANRRESWMSPTFIHETYGWHYMGKVRVEK